MSFALKQTNFLKHEVDVNPSFDTENIRKQRSAKLHSLWITILVHAVLILLLLYFVLQPHYPPYGESGVFLNLGLVDVGMGAEQPQGTASELQAPSPTESSPSASQKTKDVITQETEDAPVIQKKEDKKKSAEAVKTDNKTTTKKTENKPAVPVPPKPKALYPGNTANNSTSEGTGNKAGDQGKPNGDVNGTDYTGSPGIGGPGPGGSGGAQLGMSGRKIIYYPPIVDNSQKTGRVVVNIKVDKAGSVVWAKATQKGSTTTDSYLFQLAEEAALKTKVNADPSAAEEQFGTITYTFRVK